MDNDEENVCQDQYYSEMTDGIEYDLEEDDFDASTFHNYNQSSHNKNHEPSLNCSQNVAYNRQRNPRITSMSSVNYTG
jgi:hypothetical protein